MDVKEKGTNAMAESEMVLGQLLFLNLSKCSQRFGI
jgi:hypothetical protein